VREDRGGRREELQRRSSCNPQRDGRGKRPEGEDGDQRTLAGRVLAPRSRRGSLNLLLVPSILILRVTRVSGLVEGVAMAVDIDLEDVQVKGRGRWKGDVNSGLTAKR
jgi:hypothetical protein